MGRGCRLRSIAALCVLGLAAGSCGDDDGGAADEGSEVTDTTAEDAGERVLWDNGPCDESLEPYPLAIIATVESPVLSLRDQTLAADASVEAFNARGGVGGHCMELTICDSGGDPNKEVDCARQIVDSGVVATVNDTTAINPAGVLEVLEPAGVPRVGISPTPGETGSPITYATNAGALGATFMMIPPLARDGVDKIAVIHIDTPLANALIGLLADGLAKGYGGELVATMPVPAGTTDFQQFILASESAGAEGAILALGEAEAMQVLQAGQQLGTEMRFGFSLSNTGRADMRELGDFASQITFNNAVPPATASTDTWPVLDEIVADLEASGEPGLQRDKIDSNIVRSWMAVYALVRVVEDFGNPDDVSREAIKAAFDTAKDVDMQGLIPPWTPAGGTGEGMWARISQPWYFIIDWDAETEDFVVRPEQLNAIMEFEGTTDYEPRPVAG